MTTKNHAYQARLMVAVEELTITDGPGVAVITRGEGIYDINSDTEGVKARFTITTPASTCPTVVKARVYDVYWIPTAETQFDLTSIPSDECRLSCLIGGWIFHGTYNANSRTGKLNAKEYDLESPED